MSNSRKQTKGTARLILNYFLRGLMVVLPLALTVGVIYWFLGFVANILGLNAEGSDLKLMFFYFFLGLGIITVIGYFVRGLLAKQILDFLEGLIEKAPGLNFIFGTTRDITEAFMGENKKFNRPVVAHLSEGIHKVGFLTREDAAFLDCPGSSVVYFPYSYGLNGEMLVVDKKKLRPLDAEASNVTKFVVSGGAVKLD